MPTETGETRRDKLLTELTQVMAEALGEAMESLAFLSVDELEMCESEENQDLGEIIWVTVESVEPYRAEFSLAAEQSLVDRMCATLYTPTGMAVNEAVARDMIGEALNMIVGKVVCRLAPPTSPVVLNPPAAGRTTGAGGTLLAWRGKTEAGVFALRAAGEAFATLPWAR